MYWSPCWDARVTGEKPDLTENDEIYVQGIFEPKIRRTEQATKRNSSTMGKSARMLKPNV